MGVNSDPVSQAVSIPAGDAVLQGDLVVPPSSTGLVLFAHGSGSGRFSERNRAVAAVLHHAGLATLLMDLLTPQEESVDRYTRQYRFDIEHLGRRVVAVVDWVTATPSIGMLPIGCFGASTGSARDCAGRDASVRRARHSLDGSGLGARLVPAPPRAARYRPARAVLAA